MADQYTPKGITPLPWEDGAKGFSVTGPTSPAIGGVTVHEQCENRKWGEAFDRGIKDGVPFASLPKQPIPLSVPIVSGEKTIAISVGLTREEAEAHSAYLVHAANEYPKAIEALRNMFALVRLKYGNLDPDVNALCKQADAVLSAAREVEE